ncbi:BON domain-containing protein [Aestuariivivens sediminis]|uniref:BON domain-containing protein n=1 Tax=Aestuariivivens sediminis TaxID=2913557 RepID=UPI001F5A360C|nr:BON domain-containing protein [Aestuariivivens sediminis]
MRTDSQIKQDVLDELEWESSIDETQIGVIVENGVVTLTGVVDSYSKKIAAENAAKRVYGVKAVAEDIEINYSPGFSKSDTDIAKNVVNTLKWDTSVPDDKISIKVENGQVYLSGTVDWSFQKEAARKAIQNINGVRGITNNLKLGQQIQPDDIKDRITKAFERSAVIDANNINVKIKGKTVELTGTVHSIAEKEEARKAAFWAPGVTHVENKLKVKLYPEYA